MPAVGILARKGAKYWKPILHTTPKVPKLYGSQFGIYKKILGEESTRGGPPTIYEGGGVSYPLGAPPTLVGPSWLP